MLENLPASQRNQILNDLKHEIAVQWEMRARSEIPEIDLETSLILLNSLKPYLNHIFKVLLTRDYKLAVSEVQSFSRKHGEERAFLKGYFLPQLLREFSLLRDVLCDLLLERAALSHEERTLIDKMIDTAMSLAAEEFANTQTFEIKESLADAKSSNVHLSQFASVVAHDLKSPLAVISGYVDLLRQSQESLDLDGKDALERIASAVDRMKNLIDAVLAYAKLESPEGRFQVVSGNLIVHSALENLQDQLAEVGADVQCGSLPDVFCDPPLMGQLFQNLISNSIKFKSDKKLRIEIDARPDGEMFKFSVHDNGIGFDPAKAKEIFGLYRKLHADSQYPGSGIGLATCKRIIELHGGNIWAESSPGQGSTFYFTLPKGYVH